jgi:hypothetical protein
VLRRWLDALKSGMSLSVLFFIKSKVYQYFHIIHGRKKKKKKKTLRLTIRTHNNKLPWGNTRSFTWKMFIIKVLDQEI